MFIYKMSHNNPNQPSCTKYRICAMIPARYHSTRLPGKPLLKIGNKTIIERTYLQTLKSKLIDTIYVVTDDDRIIEHIDQIGGHSIKIDSVCLNGTERICKALNNITDQYDIVVNVQGDEPFIDSYNIDYAIQKYIDNEDDKNMVCTTLHSELYDAIEINNTGIGKMIMDKFNNVLYCSRAVIPHTKNGQLDNNNHYYGHIGIFIFRRSYLPLFIEHPNTPSQLSEDIEWLKIMEMGYKIKSYAVKSYEIGINTIDDFNYLSKKYTTK
jgi:3-deoxy-manno-octulosonate cytidylyltransferase (CMP-KDO synthetase)